METTIAKTATERSQLARRKKIYVRSRSPSVLIWKIWSKPTKRQIPVIMNALFARSLSSTNPVFFAETSGRIVVTRLENEVIILRLVLPVISTATRVNYKLFAASWNVIEPDILRHIPIGLIEEQCMLAHCHALSAIVVPRWAHNKRHFDLAAQSLHWRSRQTEREVIVHGTGPDCRVLRKVES